MIVEYDRYRYAERLFGERRYAQAARELEPLLESGDGIGLGDARQLHLRALFHSAQLGRAEDAARAVLAEHPTDSYAMVVLGRSLARQGREAEAESWRRRAEALGATTW